MQPIRKLDKSEVECRVSTATVKSSGKVSATYLLYKDARVDMKILDEHFGPMNWQREHTLIGDRLYCTISIYDSEKGVWIKKQDVGTESNAEPEKGQASDAFKRAAFNVGIGRELYTAPYISVDLEPNEYTLYKDNKTQKDKATPKLSLFVEELLYDKVGNISVLVLKDRRGKIRYSYGREIAQLQNEEQAPPPPLPPSHSTPKLKVTMDQNHKGWQKMCDAVVRGEYTIQEIQEMYHLPLYAEAALKDYVTANG